CVEALRGAPGERLRHDSPSDGTRLTAEHGTRLTAQHGPRPPEALQRRSAHVLTGQSHTPTHTHTHTPQEQTHTTSHTDRARWSRCGPCEKVNSSPFSLWSTRGDKLDSPTVMGGSGFPCTCGWVQLGLIGPRWPYLRCTSLFHGEEGQ